MVHFCCHRMMCWPNIMTWRIAWLPLSHLWTLSIQRFKRYSFEVHGYNQPTMHVHTYSIYKHAHMNACRHPLIQPTPTPTHTRTHTHPPTQTTPTHLPHTHVRVRAHTHTHTHTHTHMSPLTPLTACILYFTENGYNQWPLRNNSHYCHMYTCTHASAHEHICVISWWCTLQVIWCEVYNPGFFAINAIYV